MTSVSLLMTIISSILEEKYAAAIFAIRLQLCCNLIFFKIFCILYSQRLKLHLLSYFHSVPSKSFSKKHAAALFAIMLQICCKLLFFQFFSILHSLTPKLQIMNYFHPIPSSISKKKKLLQYLQ